MRRKLVNGEVDPIRREGPRFKLERKVIVPNVEMRRAKMDIADASGLLYRNVDFRLDCTHIVGTKWKLVGESGKHGGGSRLAVIG